MNKLASFLAVLVISTACHANDVPLKDADADVVFVCQHGSAKSVIAALYFNKIATEKGLGLRAVSRGIQPDEQLQEATRQGLRQDGMEVPEYQAAALNERVAGRAKRVVTIGIESELSYLNRSRSLQWNDVPSVSKDYQAARADMVRKVEALIDDLVARPR